MARTMNDEEMTEFVGWVESHHPEIISEFELRDVTLDTADSTPFPLKFSPTQEQVLEQIWLVMGRDDRHASGVFSMNWEEIPYIVENHLFKDSCVILSYDKPITEGDKWSDASDIVRVWDIHGIAKALKQFKPELYKKFLAKVDEHFKKLQESDRDEERSFAPTNKDGSFMTAAEYFDDTAL